VNPVGSTVCGKSNPDPVQTEETACLLAKHVWVIGAWNLDIVWYLLFGAWNFLYLKTQR
jgi:hypothetical protein